jgi:hAT family C-terminal dimerisation region
MAHTSQLVVHSGLAEASPKINNILAKCDSVVNSVHKSCRATEMHESQASMQIPSSNNTRWNSMLSMASAFLIVESQHEGTIQQISNILPSKIAFSANDFAVLREMEQLLSPFQVSTVCNQSEVVVTSSQILPTIVGLKKHIEKLEPRHCTSIRSGLLASLSIRCDHIFRQAHYLIATVVDPRVKLRWTKNLGDCAAARQAVLPEMQVLCQRTPADQAAHGTVPQQQQSTSQQQPDILFSYMNENSSMPTNDTETELVSYLSSPCSSLEPLVYWSDTACQQSFPTLYTLHLKHHCIPATSASVERVLSAAGYIASARRNRLGDESLELLVIAKCNKD